MIVKVKVIPFSLTTLACLVLMGAVAVPDCLAQADQGIAPGITAANSSTSAVSQGTVVDSQIKISHTPLTPDTLPFPGQPIDINVLLSGTGDFRSRLRGFAVIDGRILEVSPTRAFLNDYDQPTYEFSLISPLAEISYHFVLELGDGQFVASPRYTVRRSCIPKIEPADLVDANSLQPRDQVGALLEQSTLLNFDLQSYEQAIKLSEELIGRLDKR